MICVPKGKPKKTYIAFVQTPNSLVQIRASIQNPRENHQLIPKISHLKKINLINKNNSSSITTLHPNKNSMNNFISIVSILTLIRKSNTIYFQTLPRTQAIHLFLIHFYIEIKYKVFFIHFITFLIHSISF